ncbi:hypothetical protein CASFOL_002949 [Castilleja foliolosa]|uniref:SHSP domain-containing protein n=1 Tax=Castilleja foliolosa TaxID=1961234 RepID=A0ABD3EG19_9LAMI
MDANTSSANINNFEPLSDFVNEGDCNTLLLYLPGFTREQIRVQLAKSGVLKISGMRPLGDDKWSSFQKDFPISANCETGKITAKFEDGILYVRQPKLIVPEKQLTPPPEIRQDQLPETKKTDHEEPRKTTPEKPVPNKDVDKSSEDTKKADDIPEKSGGKDKQENVVAKKGTTNGIAKLLGTGGKMDAESPAARLKVARQKMSMVLVVLFAFALGMCINKLQAWFSRDADY